MSNKPYKAGLALEKLFDTYIDMMRRHNKTPKRILVSPQQAEQWYRHMLGTRYAGYGSPILEPYKGVEIEV